MKGGKRAQTDLAEPARDERHPCELAARVQCILWRDSIKLMDFVHVSSERSHQSVQGEVSLLPNLNGDIVGPNFTRFYRLYRIRSFLSQIKQHFSVGYRTLFTSTHLSELEEGGDSASGGVADECLTHKAPQLCCAHRSVNYSTRTAAAATVSPRHVRTGHTVRAAHKKGRCSRSWDTN